MKVIGLIGLKGSGKSTAFSIIKQYYPNAIELQLAGKLKSVCSSVFNIEIEKFESQKYKEEPFELPLVLTKEQEEKIFGEFLAKNLRPIKSHQGMTFFTPREILQYVGTEMLRNVDDKIHCKTIDKVFQYGVLNVVTDVRFENELEYLKNKYDFKSIYIHNDKCTTTTHASELGVGRLVLKSDYWLDNSFTLKLLDENIKKIVDNILYS